MSGLGMVGDEYGDMAGEMGARTVSASGGDEQAVAAMEADVAPPHLLRGWNAPPHTNAPCRGIAAKLAGALEAVADHLTAGARWLLGEHRARPLGGPRISPDCGADRDGRVTGEKVEGYNKFLAPPTDVRHTHLRLR